jgi:serine/threonine-protein kinase
MLRAGQLLQERYRIVDLLGEGGFSAVYLAEDTRLAGRQVAVKVMSLAQVAPADRAWVQQQFWEEAQLLARLQHPDIVEVTDFFQQGDNYFLVMAYVPGQTLADLLAAQPGRRLPEARARAIAGQVAGILNYLHQWRDPQTGAPAPIIFRDLKPQNIMVTPGDRVKLLDFGIARHFKAGQQRDTRILGTPGYAAPEQYGSTQSDPRSDVYSLGVVLHEMLTGYDPTNTPLNLPPVDVLAPHVAPQLAAAVTQATNTAPDERFYSISAFANALRATPEIPSPGSPETVVVSTQGGRSYRTLAIAAVALLFVPLVLYLLGVFSDDGTTLAVTATEPGIAASLAVTEAVDGTATAAAATAAAATTTASAVALADAHQATSAAATLAAAAAPTATATATPSPSPTPTASATPGPRFYDAFFCLEPCLPDGANATTDFIGGMARIYMRWTYENLAPGAHYERIWTNGGQVWAHYDCTWPGPRSGIDENTLSEPSGLRSGTWEVTIKVDGEVVMREQITFSGDYTYWYPAGYFDSCYGKR